MSILGLVEKSVAFFKHFCLRRYSCFVKTQEPTGSETMSVRSPRAEYTATRKHNDTQLQAVLITLDSTTVAGLRRAFERAGDIVDMPSFGAFL